MKRIALLLVAVLAAPAAQHTGETPPAFVTKIPPGYRDRRLISVAHEEGANDDIRAILGNDKAIKAYREGKLPFPDGAIISRIAWSYDPSEENNKVFGRPQSFVAGRPKNGVQFMVRDSRKYAATGGWGFAQFEDSAQDLLSLRHRVGLMIERDLPPLKLAVQTALGRFRERGDWDLDGLERASRHVVG